MMTSYVQAQTTVESREDAERIARTLVERQLAACVQMIGPVESIYRWKGEVEGAQEWLCLMKTTRDLYRDLEQALLELHRYETPEVIALPIVAGSDGYLAWLGEQVSRGGE